jgi:hypothetical protein
MISYISTIYYLTLLLVWTNWSIAAELPHNTPTVTTLNGSYYGIHNAHYNQDFFLGIPFAQPPLGELRYAAPHSLNTSWEGTKNATEIGFECIGYGVGYLSSRGS